ncbi:MAG: hypothetical protein IPK16_06995 [Anaerolineales bacterium]|nr:hypothetical protein [Anaerolineales bacterium]
MTESIKTNAQTPTPDANSAIVDRATYQIFMISITWVLLAIAVFLYGALA